MDQPSPCPSDQELAVFLDGTLDARRRSAVLTHLADCNDCTAVLAAAAAVKAAIKRNPDPALHLSGPKRLADVLPMRRSGVPRTKPAGMTARRWVGIAAALVLAVGTALLLPSHRGAGSFPPAREVAAALGEAGDLRASTLRLWPGWGDGLAFGGLAPAQVAFRLGVGLTDVQVSIAAGDFARAEEVNARIEPLIGGLAGSVTLAPMRAALARGDAGAAAAAAADLGRQIERRLPAQPAAFGRWAESGRLAALGRTPGFFERPDVRAFPREVHLSAPDPAVERELRRLSDSLRHPPTRESEYAALARSFEQILLLD